MSPSSGNAGIDREEAVPASAAPRPSSAPALEALSSLESILSESTIAIFSKSSCCACVRVKQLFEKTGASFKIIELNQRADGPMLLEALMDWTKQRTVPYVFINGKHIGGCDGDLYELENALKEWIGQRLAADNELENVLKEWSGQMLAGDNVMNEKHIAPVPINWNKNNTKWFYDICLELIATGDMEVGKLSEEVCDVICKRLLKKGIECDEHQIRNKWEASKRLHSFWHKQVASVKDAKKDDKWWKKVLKARIALTEYRELKEDPSKKIETLDMIFGCSKIEKVVQNFQSPPEDATSLQRELEFVTEDRDYLKKQLIEVQAVHENNLDDLQRKISFLSDKLKQCENEIKDLKKLVDVKDSEIHEGEELRKKMNEMILELKGNMRVFVRIRPAKDSEEDHITYPQSFELKGRGIEVKEIGQVKQYVYDKVFGPDTNQKQIFDELSDLVESSLDGHKVCIFAYGQTGSGKTHTMIGGSCNDSAGLIPRSLKQIFERIDSKQNWTYTVHVSAAEIYLKDLYDLLA